MQFPKAGEEGSDQVEPAYLRGKSKYVTIWHTQGARPYHANLHVVTTVQGSRTYFLNAGNGQSVMQRLDYQASHAIYIAPIVRRRWLPILVVKPDRTTCCASPDCWPSKPDVLKQTGGSMLEEEARKLGCKVIFLPKFHCELNFIPGRPVMIFESH